MKKIKPFKTNYKTWWLILVENIFSDLERLDWQQLQELPRIEHYFDRVIIISRGISDVGFDY